MHWILCLVGLPICQLLCALNQCLFALFSQLFSIRSATFFGIFHLFHIFSEFFPHFFLFFFSFLRLREQLSVMAATATPVLLFFPLLPIKCCRMLRCCRLGYLKMVVRVAVGTCFSVPEFLPVMGGFCEPRLICMAQIALENTHSHTQSYTHMPKTTKNLCISKQKNFIFTAELHPYPFKGALFS